MTFPPRWMPASFTNARDYKTSDFAADLLAGVTVGMVALPLAMAFGIASGATPQAGLYTAVVAGGIVSLLGGSRFQIGGPTGAFVVIVAGILSRFGSSGLALVTLMAGAILVVMGLTGLGAAVKFIPRPVTIGFTNGIALLIASTQIKDFLGLATGPVPSEFAPRMQLLAGHLRSANWRTAMLGAGSLAVILLWPRITRRVPGSIVALILGTALIAIFGFPVETIGTKFGGIPSGFPHPAIPQFHTDQILPLFPSALTVALLAAIESLLSAVVADNIAGGRHNSNVELVAQGLANLATPLFGGIPATGAIARTATNIRSGARSPISGIIHSLTVLAILLFAAPLARFVPLATLSAVLFVVAYNMGEWHEIGTILRLSPADISVWAATFALTVFADLTVAVEVGMVLSALLYIYRVSQTTTVSRVTPSYIESGQAHVLQQKDIPAYVTIIRIHGPFLFGTTEKLAEETADLPSFSRIVIVRLRNMTALDATGLHALEVFASRVRKTGREILFCGARRQPEGLMNKANFASKVGTGNVVPHVHDALVRANELESAFLARSS